MRGGAALHGRKGGGAMPRGKRAYRVLLWAVLAALLALAAFAGWRLWRVYGDAARAAQLAREMQQTAVSAAGESAAGTDGAEMPAHACPVDFETLRRDYPAVTAWLTGCGGDIDTPVAQGADNIYYLDHLPDGTRNMLGTAFLDSANSASFSDDQSFIFGHHMDTGGGVFAPLLRYQKQEYFEKNPTFTLHTPGGCYTAWVFGAFVVQERAYPYVAWVPLCGRDGGICGAGARAVGYHLAGGTRAGRQGAHIVHLYVENKRPALCGVREAHPAGVRKSRKAPFRGRERRAAACAGKQNGRAPRPSASLHGAGNTCGGKSAAACCAAHC